MLLPRFTIRTILGITTICAVFCLVLALAARGQQWAVGVSIGVLSIVVTAAVHATLYWLVRLLARALGPSYAEAERSSESPRSKLLASLHQGGRG